MRVERNRVILSALLAKLEQPYSVRTLVSGDGSFAVTAELDSVHYAHPEREGVPPGELHPATARIMNEAEPRRGDLSPSRYLAGGFHPWDPRMLPDEPGEAQEDR